jgi:hypothetical protein
MHYAIGHDVEVQDVPLGDLDLFLGLGKDDGSPRSFGKTVVTRKKMRSRNAMSAIDADGISSLTFCFLFRIATGSFLRGYGAL